MIEMAVKVSISGLHSLMSLVSDSKWAKKGSKLQTPEESFDLVQI